jgi:hypothetical protein
MRFIYLYAFVIFLSSCQQENIIIHKWNDYKIRAGKNYATGAHLAAHTGELHALVMFDGSAEYNTKDPANQSDINKLIGFSDCNSDHHDNSARFGWNWDAHAKKIKLYAYCYIDGISEHKLIRAISSDSVYDLKIVVLPDNYMFFVDHVGLIMDRRKRCINCGYMLFPYFGGTETAPHDIKIRMKILDR